MQNLSQSKLLPFLQFLSLAGFSFAVAGSAAPLLLPLSPQSTLACCGVSATKSKEIAHEKRETECCHQLFNPRQLPEKVKRWERQEEMRMRNCLSV